MAVPTNAKTFLSLGDSYTIGESVEAADRWCVQLANRLRDSGIDMADPDIIARTGWTTAELQAALKTADNQKRYDLVSLLIGVNNQYRGQSLETYQAEFRELLQTAIHFAEDRPDQVVVLSIPDWGRSPFAADRDKAQISRAIDAFNAAAREICNQANVRYVDITPLTRTAEGDPTQFAADGLHYSGAQMQKWTSLVMRNER